MIVQRSARGCLCCGNTGLLLESAVVSGFLAERAWQVSPFLTRLASCLQCGFRFFDHALTEAEGTHYYAGYRDARYVYDRGRWEPFYTQARHEGVVAWALSPDRGSSLKAVLDRAGLGRSFRIVMDHGGDRGQMLVALDAERKIVFDPSGQPTLDGIVSILQESDLDVPPDLILSCQVLEHVADPPGFLRHLRGLLATGGHLYVEVPYEHWTTGSREAPWRTRWLGWLVRHHGLLKLMDAWSTACRIKLHRLPPLGFATMREHVNYFNPKALSAAMELAGFEVIESGINQSGQTFAIGRPTQKSRDAIHPGTAGTHGTFSP